MIFYEKEDHYIPLENIYRSRQACSRTTYVLCSYRIMVNDPVSLSVCEKLMPK